MADPLFVETVALDGMWRRPDGASTGSGQRYRIAWFDPPFRPRDAEATQALGICFTGDRRIVLVTGNGEDWTLPGGAPEPGETFEQALAREVGEEACARREQQLHRLPTSGGTRANRVAYYQTRFWARIALDEFKPEHEMTARRLVSPREFRSELSWGEEKSAGMILDRGLAIEQDLSNRGRGDSQGSGPSSQGLGPGPRSCAAGMSAASPQALRLRAEGELTS